MGGVKGTRYLLKIRNHAPRKAENSVPPLFFEKAGDKKNVVTKSLLCSKIAVRRCIKKIIK